MSCHGTANPHSIIVSEIWIQFWGFQVYTNKCIYHESCVFKINAGYCHIPSHKIYTASRTRKILHHKNIKSDKVINQ